jgi:hypothetical protein
MAEIRTVTTLRRERDEIRRTIRNYERKLDQAKADLAHLSSSFIGLSARSISLPSKCGKAPALLLKTSAT